MEFQITIIGMLDQTDLTRAERILGAFLNQVRALGVGLGLKLSLPVEVVIPEKETQDTTSPTCVVRGQTAVEAMLLQAEMRIRQAHAAGDDDAWLKHYTVWLSLFSLKHKIPWPVSRSGSC